ncbi:GIY-YIG nuclease family protein [Oleisolibacter albus]|uniref:GIY-YIG nuclease family protein n=1 Tax=Oleisolibacter albus TaxID=2171757 RepID=UPI000DF3A2A0|nr:GIY-YIG nuclease family protein [Oleisolibacter albus]
MSGRDTAPLPPAPPGPPPLPSAGFHRTADGIPAVPGAYVLLIRMGQPLSVALPGRPPVTLAAGRYLYCGSARGPGGLRARLARHLSPDKTLRWHVDRLTCGGNAVGAWIFPAGSVSGGPDWTECALAAALEGLPVPAPGFGSSDCPTCRSHLLAWPGGAGLPFVPVPD